MRNLIFAILLSITAGEAFSGGGYVSPRTIANGGLIDGDVTLPDNGEIDFGDGSGANPSQGSAGWRLRLYNDGTNSYGYGLSSTNLWAESQGVHTWFLMSVEKMRLHGSGDLTVEAGKLGVSIYQPIYDLDVTGGARFTGQAIVAGSMTVAGRTNFSGLAFSSAAITNISSANTSGWTCGTGSTLTWVSNGNLAEVSFNGEASDGTLNAIMQFWVLLDGIVPAPMTTTIPGSYTEEPVANDSAYVGFKLYIRPTAGTRQLCLVGTASAGTMVINGNAAGEFAVREF